MRKGIALLGMLTLAGCDAAPAAPESGTRHSIDPATGEVRMTIPSDKGAATVRSGVTLPVRLPKGFTLVAGARVTGNSQVTRPGGGENTLLAFDTDTPAADVIAHTRKEAEAAGFAVTLDKAAGDTRVLVAVSGDTRITATATQGTPTTAQFVVDAGASG